jgi:hypothetical protein
MAFTFQALYDNPIVTAKQYALMIAGYADSREKTLATPDSGNSLEFRQVYAGRETFASIRSESATQAVIDVFNTENMNSVQSYYLPWGRGTIYRVTPKISHTETIAGNLFFTANLDGCMVSVSGTQEVPTIYHANSAGVPIPNKFAEVENQFKIKNMFVSLHKFGTIAPKVNRIDESPQMPETSHFNILEYDRGSKQGELGNNLYSKELYYGTVFGVRKQGKWTFYKQSYKVQELVDMNSGKKNQTINVVSADLFWPTRFGNPGIHRF